MPCPRPLVLFLIIILLAVLISACATTPEFNLQNVLKDVPPTQSAAHIADYRGKKVLWGGVILNSTNTKQGTQFEVLAYPLDSDMRPQSNKTTEGRFLANVSLYLETADYAPGRLLTVVGELADIQQGKIGEAVYAYPVLQINQHYLWPRQEDRPVDTSVHFGIGVILH